MKLLLATGNSNKLKEIRDKFLGIENLEILSLDDFKDSPDIIEDATTFDGNALKKARIISEFTNLPVLSDDSGLEIDALQGKPGVYSARYAGENATDDDRNRLVLKEMREIPDDKRTAKFVCVIAIVFPDGREYIARGECEGIIVREKRGENGFGYDPIFYLPHLKKTVAELSFNEKNRISHRAFALEKAIRILQRCNS